MAESQAFVIADASDIVRKVGKRILSELGFVVSEASNFGEALACCRVRMPSYLMVDAAMEGALELIGAVRALPGGDVIKIYYCVIEEDIKKLMAGKRAGASDFLLKPFDRKILTNVFGSRAVAA